MKSPEDGLHSNQIGTVWQVKIHSAQNPKRARRVCALPLLAAGRASDFRTNKLRSFLLQGGGEKCGGSFPAVRGIAGALTGLGVRILKRVTRLRIDFDFCYFVERVQLLLEFL
jgi:hypothetical protein